jgi:hypothetical protein
MDKSGDSESVTRAVDALKAWHTQDVETAARLLESYAGRHELSEAERLRVLARFAEEIKK